ncbi:glycine--tRNA ligase, beta subunit [Neorickettsia helminthoeca str. Oregon]|uniref:Glycine--tRNA ligase beta subunit n=2 Tax=Neorickettsia helminthoeca TaxID=33994 RepID=X5HMF6_9RICK|nr:glycine--tRNA ligase, beta subunit [Neorickettsia helminthoeca str. Oregon]
MRNLKVGTVEVFVSCRRIAVIVHDVDTNFTLSGLDRKGPSLGSGIKIVEKFASSAGVTVPDLYTRTVGSKEYYFAPSRESNITVVQVLKKITEDILMGFAWPRSMRWGKYNFTWIRPIKSITCMLGGEVVPVQFHHYSAANVTRGSGATSDFREITIGSAEEYVSLLRRNSIILSQAERRNIIKEQIAKIEAEHNFCVQVTDSLLDEVVGISESPNAMLGSFDEDFLRLPEELIKTVIISHQKVFPVYQNRKLLNKFIAVSSLANDAPVRGYERVITARLADAVSMVLIDTKIPLVDYAPKLKQLIFHKKLGSFSEKTGRIVALAKFVALWVPNASIIKVEKAAEIAKVDLLTTFVRDFPELAGFVGSYYLKLSGEDDCEIINALRDQYLPVDAADVCPAAPVTVTLALADKMDNLVGLISANEKVTSTRDPLGLRRAAIGILRIIIENNINVPLKVFLMKAIDLYPASLFRSLIDRISINPDEEKQRKSDVMMFILEFFSERLKALLLKQGVGIEVFNSVASNIEHPLLLKKKCVAIAVWLRLDSGIEFLKLHKRISGILETTDVQLKSKYNKKVFVSDEERMLAESFESFQGVFTKSLKNGDFEKALSELSGLAGPLTLFMDNVIINATDPELKRNRIGLLNTISETVSELCQFEVLCK